MKRYRIDGDKWSVYVDGISAVRNFLAERGLKLPRPCKNIYFRNVSDEHSVYFVYEDGKLPSKLFAIVEECRHYCKYSN